MSWVFEPAAVEEFTAAAEWYRERAGAKIAEAFVAEVRRTMSLVGEHRELGALGVAGTRRILLRRFPFVFVYRVEVDVLRVMAQAHERRRPNYWRQR